MSTCSEKNVFIDKDYVTLRNENLDKISIFYKDYLSKYSNKYLIYQSKLDSEDQDDINEGYRF